MLSRFLSVLLLSLLIIGCDRENAQQIKERSFKIGILLGVDFFEPTMKGFKAEMNTLGYREGDTVSYDIGRARGSAVEMKKIADQFVKDEVSLILAITNGGALAAKKATAISNIPVVFAIVLAPIETGVVDSLTNPTQNITGVRNPLGEFIGKRLDILKRLSPKTQRVLVFNKPDYPTIPIVFKRLRTAAQQLEMELIDVPISGSADIESYLKRSNGDDFDAIMIMPDPVVQNPESLLATYSFANKHGLPVVANIPKQVENGALFTYLSDSYKTGREAAQLANSVLAKTVVKGLPIINSEPQLILNIKTAKQLKINVDESLLALSHRIIE